MDATNLPESQPAAEELPPASAPPLAALDAVPTMGFDTNTCAICLDPLRGGASYITVSCGHKFHLTCTTRHAATRRGAACPLCRAPLSSALGGLPDAADGEPAPRRPRLEYTLDEPLPPPPAHAPPAVTITVTAEWTAPREDGTLDGVATLVVPPEVPARAGVDVVRAFPGSMLRAEAASALGADTTGFCFLRRCACWTCPAPCRAPSWLC